jgi:hypothetical protein
MAPARQSCQEDRFSHAAFQPGGISRAPGFDAILTFWTSSRAFSGWGPQDQRGSAPDLRYNMEIVAWRSRREFDHFPNGYQY